MLSSILSMLGASGPQLVGGAIAAAVAYAFLIGVTRLNGLRSYSKMSAFDFAMTVAVGSLLASAASGQAPLVAVLVGVGVLYLLQFLVALGRRHGAFAGAVDNSPLLLMDGDRVLDDNLREARITLSDLRGKLREANVLDCSSIRAVVLESTGDVSVLHGTGRLDPDLLQGVRRG